MASTTQHQSSDQVQLSNHPRSW